MSVRDLVSEEDDLWPASCSCTPVYWHLCTQTCTYMSKQTIGKIHSRYSSTALAAMGGFAVFLLCPLINLKLQKLLFSHSFLVFYPKFCFFKEIFYWSAYCWVLNYPLKTSPGSFACHKDSAEEDERVFKASTWLQPSVSASFLADAIKATVGREPWLLNPGPHRGMLVTSMVTLLGLLGFHTYAVPWDWVWLCQDLGLVSMHKVSMAWWVYTCDSSTVTDPMVSQSLGPWMNNHQQTGAPHQGSASYCSQTLVHTVYIHSRRARPDAWYIKGNLCFLLFTIGDEHYH